MKLATDRHAYVQADRKFRNLILGMMTLSFAVIVLPQAASADSAPASFTYQGKIFNAAGTQPLQSGAVTFTLQLRSPDGQCLLFEETHSRNMTGTGGVFSLNVGEGTNTGKTALTIQQVVDNSALKAGEAACSYQPITGDTRRIRLIYDEGSGPVTFASDQTLRSVPWAMNATALQGKTKDGFVQITAQITQNKIEQLSTWSQALLDLAQGTSTTYAKASDLPIAGGVLNLTGAGVRVADVPTAVDHAVNRNYVDARMAGSLADLTGLSNGQGLVWNTAQGKWVVGSSSLSGDVSGSFGTTVVGKIQGVSVSATAPTSGQILTYNTGNTRWEATTPGASLPTGGASGHALRWNGAAWISGFPNVSQLRGVANGAQFPTNCTTSETLIYASPMDRYECEAITVANTNVTGLGAAATLGVGTIAGTVAAGNDTRIVNAVQTSSNAGGDVSGSWSALTVQRLRGVSVSATAPTANQVLKYDSGTSSLIFAADSNSGGTVTSVTPGTGFTSSTPITSTGTLNINVGTGANQIVQMSATGKLPAMDASDLTGLPFQNVAVVTADWTPPLNVRRVYVQVWGGGGAGANGVILGISGSGGGGGGYAAGFLNVTPGVPVPVTVGGGGLTTGAPGTASSFGAISASGGAGGVAGAVVGSIGGNILAGTVTSIGGFGGVGTAGVTIVAITVAGVGGAGGLAAGGGGVGGFGSLGATTAGAGTVPGGGGGGGGSSLAAGTFGPGAAGRVLVYY